MLTILKGNIIEAKSIDELAITENGYIVLDDGVIQGVFPHLPARYDGAHIVDYGNRLIMQSFSDMHLHAPQYPMLGIGMDLPLLDWLSTYTFPTEANFADTALAQDAYEALARDLVNHGTTRACVFSSIHCDATLILMEALEKAGICAYVGKVNMDQNGGTNYQETTEASIAETKRWLSGCDRFTNVRPILTPRFTPTCSDKLMHWLGDAAREQGLYVQSHLSENMAEIQWVKELHPDCKQYWETYDKYGLFNDHTIMAHCVHSDLREQEALRSHHVLVAHCPDSNINICSGLVPVRDMLDRGLWIALGSDIAGGANLSMPYVITEAIRMSKAQRIDTDWNTPFLSVSQAYFLGTTAGASYFGAKAGFAKGDKLHAVIINDDVLPGFYKLSVRERFDRAIYLTDDRHIEAVYSEGRRIKGEPEQ